MNSTLLLLHSSDFGILMVGLSLIVLSVLTISLCMLCFSHLNLIANDPDMADDKFSRAKLAASQRNA